MPDDSKIIELFFLRDEQAIVRLSEKYGAVCSRISRNILKNEADAEECVNDAYLAAWNTIPPQRPDPLKTYILRIVRNISVAKYHSNTSQKRNSYYDIALDELENALTTPVSIEQEIDSIELVGHIDRFLDTLDKDSRLIFLCRYWCSDNLTSIAQAFHTTPHNISVRLMRIRKKLKKFLVKEGVEI